ncbi:MULTISPECIES: hypothetical protein [unclassified Sphingomonas]|uniref:hypothetical protein n=1 Tax=unclassified Sphingomonas TaxID=196159 RepID=UPI002269DC4E|nr:MULTISPECIES: hypothetical protein [unclassified Sphingomonas]
MIARFKKITLALALGASALAVAAPAEAQHYGDYHGRDNAGTAVIASVAGLAIGAALASSANRRDDGYYYDEGYDGPVVAYAPVYDGYYEGGYRGYVNRDYNGYRGDYRGGRGYDERRNHRDDHHHDRDNYGRGGGDGYRR